MNNFVRLIIFLLITRPLLCNSESLEKSKFVSIGFGSTLKAFEGNHSGISIGITGQYQMKKDIVSLQFVSNGESRSLAYNPRPNLSISHFGILYSKFRRSPENIISIGAGPALVRFTDRGDLIKDNYPSASEYEKIVSNYFGFIIHGQALAFRKIGIGLNLYANINSRNTFLGFFISLYFGKFK